MSTNETPALTLLPREGNGPIAYKAPREGDCYANFTLTKTCPQGTCYIDGSVLVVRYSANRGAGITPEVLAHAVLSMAAHCPAMRDDLIARLTAQAEQAAAAR
jgi:hypothetical protein